MSDIHDRVSRSRSVIAHEGWPWLIGTLVVGVICARLGWHDGAIAAGIVCVGLVLMFRDPNRVVLPVPDAVYSPVDGWVVGTDDAAGGDGDTRWWRVRIRVNHAGAYTVRAPIEGRVLEIPDRSIAAARHTGLCLRSEEGDHVLLTFPRGGWLRSPRAFVRYGERLGHGERFAYLRLAPLAVVYLPRSSRLRVAAGDRVRAGVNALADLIHD
jgi:phosphatidylserine decarboxylase